MPKNRITELREAHQLSQRQLGEQVGVDGSTISRWERSIGTIPDPTKQHLAEIFGVSVPWLMGWDSESNGDDNGEEAI